jgi:hypothetical protein
MVVRRVQTFRISLTASRLTIYNAWPPTSMAAFTRRFRPGWPAGSPVPYATCSSAGVAALVAFEVLAQIAVDLFIPTKIHIKASAAILALRPVISCPCGKIDTRRA